MGTPVRVNEDNYIKLQKEAERERRSVVSQLNVILDDRYGRNTTGVTVSVNGSAPIKAMPGGVIEYEGKTPPSIVRVPEVDVSDLIKNKSEATPIEQLDELDELIKQGEQSTGELDCCQHPTRPCKHWQWDTNSGDGYKNILSGRFREAD